MIFILKIYFFGLIAFVPNSHSKQMTALVIDARPGFHASDGTAFPSHYPVLLARAGKCQGDCRSQDQQIANHLFGTGSVLNPKLTLQDLSRTLGAGGGAWELNGDQILIETTAARQTAEASSPGLEVLRTTRSVVRKAGETPVSVPANLREAEDFSWVAEMGQIVKGAGKVDPDCLSEKPTKDLIVGRVKLTQGTLKTYRLIEYDKNIPSFFFQPLAASAPTTSYSQGLADWTVVEIPIQGCEATLQAKNFATGEIRSMTLSPSDCKAGDQVVEVAMMNIPDPSQRHDHEAARGQEDKPQAVGTHFELFYELSESRPSWRQKAVPHASKTAVNPAAIDPGDIEFLKILKIPRAGTYSHPICPQAVFDDDPNA